MKHSSLSQYGIYSGLKIFHSTGPESRYQKCFWSTLTLFWKVEQLTVPQGLVSNVISCANVRLR